MYNIYRVLMHVCFLVEAAGQLATPLAEHLVERKR